MAETPSYSERDLDFIPFISFTFVENYIKSNKKSSGEKSINKGFKYYSEGYIQDLRVIKMSEGCQVTGKCYRSQRKNEQPHQIKISFKHQHEAEVSLANCSCPIGLSGLCGHVVGALYQLANYKGLGYKALPEDVAKTSQPQTFHLPRGIKITGKAVQDLEVRGYSSKKQAPADPSYIPRNIGSTLYNPIRGEKITWKDHVESFNAVDANMLILPALKTEDVQFTDSKYGKVPKGSVLSYQQKLETGFLMNVYDGVEFPDLPSSNVMLNLHETVLDELKSTNFINLQLSKQESVRFEKQTRLQSKNPFWYKIRKNRIAASKVGEIYKRKKEPSSLVKRLKSTRSVLTSAMREGLVSEPTAVSAYAALKKNSVNIFPSGVVVNIWAPWLAASPDRKVYDPSRAPPFGLLEVKCPQISSVLEAPYLKKNAVGELKLNRNHQYYYQVLAQLAVTGLEWCDFFVWCKNDNHCETIYFNNGTWQEVKNKIDNFFFNHFI